MHAARQPLRYSSPSTGGLSRHWPICSHPDTRARGRPYGRLRAIGVLLLPQHEASRPSRPASPTSTVVPRPFGNGSMARRRIGHHYYEVRISTVEMRLEYASPAPVEAGCLPMGSRSIPDCEFDRRCVTANSVSRTAVERRAHPQRDPLRQLSATPHAARPEPNCCRVVSSDWGHRQSI